MGHHQLTFEAAGLALGDLGRDATEYFDLCRRRRNVISYEGDEVGQGPADELLTETLQFARIIDQWMSAEHPGSAE